MNLSKVKLVVSDMDGTLLNSNHEISSRFFDLFHQMKQYDIIFVAASGRPLYGITDKFSHIKDDIIIVGENGGIAMENNKIILSHPIETDNLKKVIDVVMTVQNIHPVFCSRNRAYVMSQSKPLLKLLSEYYSNYKLISTTDDIEDDIYKVALFHEENSEKFIYPFIKPLESHFKIKLSATHWVDISENIANKGNAIKFIQEKYNISKNETIVFGDYHNDLEMMEQAYFSYAMKNAHPEVKQKARFKTKSNNDYGVEFILQQLISEKEKTVFNI